MLEAGRQVHNVRKAYGIRVEGVRDGARGRTALALVGAPPGVNFPVVPNAEDMRWPSRDVSQGRRFDVQKGRALIVLRAVAQYGGDVQPPAINFSRLSQRQRVFISSGELYEELWVEKV